MTRPYLISTIVQLHAREASAAPSGFVQTPFHDQRERQVRLGQLGVLTAIPEAGPAVCL